MVVQHVNATQVAVMFVSALLDAVPHNFSCHLFRNKIARQVKPGFQIVVPVARIVSVASNFWKRQGRSYGNTLAITQDDPCDRNDQSSEIDSSSILATETTGKDSQAFSLLTEKIASCNLTLSNVIFNKELLCMAL